jgi:hypothetical protein
MLMKYQLNKSKQNLKLTLVNTIESEVLVLGSGLIGLLMTYYLTKKNIRCVMVNDGFKHDLEDDFYDFDVELFKLSQFIHPDEHEEFFKKVMDTIYQFDAIIEEVGQDCDYERNPSVVYKSQLQDINKGYPIANGLLTYYSGITFNPRQLSESLKSYCITHGAVIINDAVVDTIDLDDEVEINTKGIRSKIKAKKLVMASELSDFLFTEDMLKSYLDYSECLIEDEIPYVGSLDYYPNIYFNLGNLKLLNGLMGANLISDLYIMDDFDTIQDIKFNCI